MFLLACTAPGGPPAETSPADTAPVDSATDSPADSEPVDTTAETDPADTDSPADTTPLDTVDTGQPPLPWRSALYPEDWDPAFTTKEGYFLHDFSYAGYGAGERSIPTLAPTADVTTFGADPTGAEPSAAAFQAALDAGGVVAVPAGTYRIEAPLRVTIPGTVLQGAGSSATFLRFEATEGMSYSAHLRFTGAVSETDEQLLTADAAPRDRTVSVADGSAYAVGDRVHVGHVITDDYVEEHGMTGVWVEFNGEWRAFHRRTVVAVHGNVLTLDVPFRNPLRVRDAASVRRAGGYLTEVGVEGLSVSTVTDVETAWTLSQVHAITFDGVEDGWVRDVHSYAADGGDHLSNCGILVTGSRRVTVTDGVMAHPQNRGGGGNGYLYEVRTSNEVLFSDLTATMGRHNFIQNWDFGTSGVVWLRTLSEEGNARLGSWDPVGYTAYSEFHHSLATANLIDQSVATDGWQAVNRQDESSGAGHSATETVFWNLQGEGYLRSLQWGMGYVVGTDDVDLEVDPEAWDWNDAGEGTAPEDHVEGVGAAATLDPPSLYEDQLRRRLGS